MLYQGITAPLEAAKPIEVRHRERAPIKVDALLREFEQHRALQAIAEVVDRALVRTEVREVVQERISRIGALPREVAAINPVAEVPVHEVVEVIEVQVAVQEVRGAV